MTKLRWIHVALGAAILAVGYVQVGGIIPEEYAASVTGALGGVLLLLQYLDREIPRDEGNGLNPIAKGGPPGAGPAGYTIGAISPGPMLPGVTTGPILSGSTTFAPTIGDPSPPPTG